MISAEDIYIPIKHFSSTTQGMVMPDTIEKRDSYTIYGEHKTDSLKILKQPWRIAFEQVPTNSKFEIVRIVDGVIVRLDGGDPYVEGGNQFIQNMIMMHTKFPEMPATGQLEIDFLRLQQSVCP